MPRTKRKEIVWEGDIYIDRVAELKEELLKAFDKYEEIHLEVSKITDFDIAGIQLIYASHKEALLRQKKFEVVGEIYPPIERLLRQHGLSIETFKTGIAFNNHMVKFTNFSSGEV